MGDLPLVLYHVSSYLPDFTVGSAHPLEQEGPLWLQSQIPEPQGL